MPNDHNVPTLDDVARLAGVSTATVSRCLNMSDKVSEQTRERVMQAVENLGYTPHFGARAMAARRTTTIGAIIPTMDNAIFARGIQAFQEKLHTLGYTLLVASNAYQPKLEAEQIKALVARGADGLLLIGYERDEAIYDYLDRRGVPTLIAWSFLDQIPRPAIGFDNRASMRVLADKVLEMGHSKLGVISGIIDGNDRAAERLKGIRDALDAKGLDSAGLPVVEAVYEIEHGAQAFETLMTADDRPTVVMCSNDVLAVGALQKAREMGLDVPGDVSVTGFDDIELARITTPAITTVHVPHRRMGERAATELIRMVERESSGASIQLDPHLIMRDSLRAL